MSMKIHRKSPSPPRLILYLWNTSTNSVQPDATSHLKSSSHNRLKVSLSNSLSWVPKLSPLIPNRSHTKMLNKKKMLNSMSPYHPLPTFKKRLRMINPYWMNTKNTRRLWRNTSSDSSNSERWNRQCYRKPLPNCEHSHMSRNLIKIPFPLKLSKWSTPASLPLLTKPYLH